MLLFAFDMACVGHINHGLWRHPRDRSVSYTDLDYWTNLAKIAERGLFDGIFIADISGVYDVWKGGPETALRLSVQTPVNDPVIPLSAMAHVTRHLGFGVTVNILQEHPYLLARRFSTLDHLTKGRIGWNIVTGYLDSAARAIGQSALADHDHRYDLADESLAFLYRLWERSWEEGAVVRDRESGVYADPAKVHSVTFQGAHLRVSGLHLSEPSPQRTPVLFQAGSSGRGKRFAAQHAEVVFVAGADPRQSRRTVDQLKQAARAEGRADGDIKTVQLLTVVVGRTTAEAQDKVQDYRRFASEEAALAHYSASTGIDLSRFGPEDHIVQVSTNSNQSALAALHDRGPTLAQIRSDMLLGSRQKPVVGSPVEVADALEGWIREAGVDGFNLARTVTPECHEDFIELVVPVLQERGLFKTGYGEGTLREKLFGRGPLLPSDHAGGRLRNQLSGSNR